ncbi:MAG TPA: response regulator [Planktothrix sp.]|jgi:CheY-like chemotaxis protein
MKKPLILVVEDDPVVQDLTSRQLAHLGCDAVGVTTGEEAVARNHEDLAMILMDVGLPGIDGRHATLIIREKELKEQRKRIPIVGLTAHSDKQSCTLAGMDDYLQKPALLNDMKRVIEKWIDTHRAG